MDYKSFRRAYVYIKTQLFNRETDVKIGKHRTFVWETKSSFSFFKFSQLKFDVTIVICNGQ